MKFKSLIIAACAVALSCVQAFAQATILPPGETCFSALAPTSGGPGGTGTGFIGLPGTITPGSGYVNGTYGGVSLTGGSGSNGTADIVVSGGVVTQVTILNPGVNYVVGDVLSAAAANLGGTGGGFSFPVSSVSINYSLAGGTVGFYIPNTLSVKQTWQDAGQTVLNTNPVALDANGCAVIYGAGIYRQILKDSSGNTVWDKLTASTGPSGIFWAGTAGGTGNAVTITDSAFASQDGATIQFRANATNTGPTTLSVSGGTAYAIVNDTTTGPAALSGGEIAIGNTPMVTFDAPNLEFHIINPAASTGGSGGSSASIGPPQGYLNLVGQATGDVIQVGDVTGVSTIFYSPYVGNTLPIWNGSLFKTVTFSELTMTLTTAGSPLSAIQDECVFSNNGVPTLVTGPSWTTASAGAGSRGSGAGSAQLTRLQGIWVNAVSITAYNGLSSYTIPANQCTYVGSIYIDSNGAAGTVTAQRSYGLQRTWDVWNAYNRQPIILLEGISVASWTYGTATIRPSNNTVSSNITTFTGLPEELISLNFTQTITGGGLSVTTQIIASWSIGVGWNSTTTFSGQTGFGALRLDGGALDGNNSSNAVARYTAPPGIGINVATTLEITNGITNASVTYFGNQNNMLMTAFYRG